MEKLPDPIKPGWSNGVVELLNPVEDGWRLLDKTVELVIDNPETTTGGWHHGEA